MLQGMVMCLEQCSETAPICGNLCCDSDAECVDVGGSAMCSVTGSVGVSGSTSAASSTTRSVVTISLGGPTTGAPVVTGSSSVADESAKTSGAKIVPVKSTANHFPTASFAVVAGIVGVMAGLVCVMKF